MSRRLLFYFLFFAPMLAAAQVTLTVQLPGSLVTKDQLWNISVINNTSQSFSGTLSVTLQDPSTGQNLFSGTSSLLVFNPGLKVITYPDVLPVQYANNGMPGSTNMLPVGNYSACFQLVKSGERQELLATECVPLQVSPLSPPQLSYPFDTSHIQTLYPQFSWIPPSIAESFPNLEYKIILAEKDSNQSTSDAIAHNIPVFQMEHITIPFQTLPSSASKLKEGASYVWQVTATSSTRYAVNSEVWSFTVAGSDSFEAPANEPFIIIPHSNEPSGIHYTDRVLRIAYYSFDPAYTTAFQFLDQNRSTIKTVQQKVVYGDNFFTFPLSGSFQSGKVYRLQFTDNKQLVRTILFSIN